MTIEDTLRGLEIERAGYEKYGRTDRAKQVADQIKALSKQATPAEVETADDAAEVETAAEAKRPRSRKA